MIRKWVLQKYAKIRNEWGMKPMKEVAGGYRNAQGLSLIRPETYEVKPFSRIQSRHAIDVRRM